MIATFWLYLGYQFYSFLVSFLPSGSLPAGISTSFTTIVSYMFKFNAILPIDTLFQVLTATLVVEAAVLLLDGFLWILRKIPFVNVR